MAACKPDSFGANPVNVKWDIVRGDTSPLRIEFYQPNEVDLYDINGWEYAATAYDPKNDVSRGFSYSSRKTNLSNLKHQPLLSCNPNIYKGSGET